MAEILGTQTLNGLVILEVDSDPSLVLGTPAPIGSIASVNDGSGLYLKTSAPDTGWVKVVTL